MTNLMELPFKIAAMLEDLKERYGGQPHLTADPVHSITQTSHDCSTVHIDLCPSCSVGAESIVVQLEGTNHTREIIMEALCLGYEFETRH